MQKIKFPISSFSVGAVIYIDFPFDDDKTKTKRRPAIIVDYNKDITRVIVLKVTTHGTRTRYDYPLSNPELANLRDGSVVRCNHILTLSNNFKCEKHGSLSRKDLASVKFLYLEASHNSDIVVV